MSRQKYTKQGILDLNNLGPKKEKEDGHYILCAHAWSCDKHKDICKKCGAVLDCMHV